MSEYYPAKRLRLSPDAYDYIKEYARENNISHDNRTINKIIEEHKEMKEMKQEESSIVSSITENISKEINKEIRRIRLGTNNTDRNTQIIIELLNGLFINQNVKDIMTTDDMETDALRTAKELIQKRIEVLQQKRSDSLKGGESNNG